MQREFVSLVFASLIILVALASAEGIIPARMAEVGIIVLPALAFATLKPQGCGKASKSLMA